MKSRLILLVVIAASVVAACNTDESPMPSRRIAVGQVVARLSQPDSTIYFESLQALSVAPDAQSVYVLDRLARRVYQVSTTAVVLAAFGRQGLGPGEIGDALAIRADPRGVWVLDREGGRFLLFSPDGEHLETVTPNVPWPLSRSFAVGRDGLVFPDFSSFQTPERDESLIARAPLTGEGFVSLDVPESIPPELAAGSNFGAIMERQMGWLLHSVAPGEVALILNSSSPAVWSMKWQDDRVTDIVTRPVPEAIGEAISRVLVRDRPPPGAELRPITGVHNFDGQLWVTTGGIQSAFLGFSVPPSADAVPTLLEPGTLRGQHTIRDGVIVGDRFIAVTETEILWADLVDLTEQSGSGQDDR